MVANGSIISVDGKDGTQAGAVLSCSGFRWGFRPGHGEIRDAGITGSSDPLGFLLLDNLGGLLFDPRLNASSLMTPVSIKNWIKTAWDWTGWIVDMIFHRSAHVAGFIASWMAFFCSLAAARSRFFSSFRAWYFSASVCGAVADVAS